MQKIRTYSRCLEKLQKAGLRPTKQRLGLARLLFEGESNHVTAEKLHKDAHNARLQISLATVYNTLNQFREAGLLQEVVIKSGNSYFCTNVEKHHHIFNETTGELTDIPATDLAFARFPKLPEGLELDKVDVVIRVREDEQSK